MKRTRTPKVGNPSSSTRNIGIQADFDSVAEITKLQEQVKHLQLQYNDLQQHMETFFKKFDITTQHRQLYRKEASKSIVERYSCTCKGNCSSRVCGCMKKTIKCNSLCKCNDKICQNWKSEHEENKENINKNDIEISKKQNEAIEITKTFKDLFSPNMSETYKSDKYSKSYKDLEETQTTQTDNIYFNNMTDMKNLQINKTSKITNNTTSRKHKKNKEQQQSAIQIEKTESDISEITANCIASKNNENVMIMFDPMKPKHQLSRTPPNSKKSANKSLEMDNITELQSHYEPNNDTIIASSVQDIKEEKIDWQQHNAQLIPCKKCKRTFMPHRIQKHEACCKRI